MDTEKIINSLMDENFPSLTLTDQFSYKQSGELNNPTMPGKTSTLRNRQLQLQFTVHALLTTILQNPHNAIRGDLCSS